MKMKDSGIEWIGEIPETWEVVPLFYCVNDVNTKNQQLAIKHALKFTYGEIVDKATYDEDTPANILEKIKNYTVVKKKDIIINGLNLAFDFVTQRVGEVKKDGGITSAYMAIRPNDKVISRYLTYLLKTYDNLKAFHNMGGGVRKILNYKELSKQRTLLPTRSEQQQIADFLDRKTTEIDGLIDKINAEIDLLERYKHAAISNAVTIGIDSNSKLKTSNVDYIPILNSNWRITKLGYICNKLMRPFNSTDTALICSNQGKVIERPDSASGIMVSGDNAMQGIKNGDIAIHGMDTWHGAIALSNKNGKITRVVHVCESIEDNRFIVYYLQHLAFQGVYKLISNGVRGNTSDFRSWEKVKNIYISIPESMQEQARICDYLDELTSKIDKNINQKQQQITQLTEYKNSLIFEYVTGKKQVKEAN